MDATNQWEDSEVTREQILAMNIGDVIHFGGGAAPDGSIKRISNHTTDCDSVAPGRDCNCNDLIGDN